MKCPAFEQVIDYLDGKLMPTEGAHVAAHLATDCAACAETRTWYERVRAVAASDDSVAPPAWVFKQAVRIFDTVRRPRLAERLGDAIARLVFDSFARPQLAGIRSTETANRQLLYRAGDYSIDVQVAPSSGARGDLIGQVLREGETTFESVANLRLDIARGGEALYSTVTDEMGEFKISDIDYGIYDLRIEMADGRITIPELPVAQD
jgi:anti-sigma factor RsiW